MRAMVLEAPHEALREQRIARPRPGYGQLLIRVRACGVCRTDAHICDGELSGAKLPLIPGHQIVGTVAEMADGVEGFSEGQRVGIPWLGRACGDCRYCLSDRENLCERAEFTGYQLDGGYAEYAVAEPRFALPLPGSFPESGICAENRRSLGFWVGRGSARSAGRRDHLCAGRNPRTARAPSSR